MKLPGATVSMRCVAGGRPRPAVVFFHGLLGDSHSWEVFAPYATPEAYADCYYVDFNLDARRSEPLTFDGIIAETLALMREGPGIGERPLTLVGNSFGGHVATYLCAHDLAQPRNLVLFGPGGVPEVLTHRSKLKSYRTIGRILDVSFKRIFSDPGTTDRMRDKVERYKRRIAPVKRRLARNLLHLTKSVKAHLLTHDDLARVRTPTTLVWGKNDVVTPPPICAVFEKHLPNVSVEWLESGHASHIECAEEASLLLREVVAGAHPPRTSPP